MAIVIEARPIKAKPAQSPVGGSNPQVPGGVPVDRLDPVCRQGLRIIGIMIEVLNGIT